MTDFPLAVGLWAKRSAGGWGKVTDLTTWTEAAVEPRHNQAGPWSLTLPFNAQAAKVTPAHLVTFDFRDRRFTGRIDDFGPGADESGAVKLDMVGLDVWSVLSGVMGYPTPTAAVASQSEARYYATGPAETVLRSIILANFARLGIEVTCEPSQGRGSNVTVMSAFPNLGDLVREKASAAGLGVRLGLVNTTSRTRAALTLEFYEPRDRSNRVRLSHKVGNLKTWKQTDKRPTATRVVVQATLEETGRTVSAVDSSNDLFVTTEAHGLKTGDLVTFTGDSLPAPLLPGVAYAAIGVGSIFTSTGFKVAATRADAARALAVNLTSAGSGTITVTEQTRRYAGVADTDAEAEWGFPSEVLVEGGSDDTAAGLTEIGTQALAEAAAQSGFDLETAEAAGMRFGDHYDLGDLVRVELLTGVASVQPLGAVRVHASTDEGLRFNAVPGNPDAASPMFGQAAITRALRRQIHALQRKD